MVQEYERAVIFRLGRLMQGGAKGPGEWQTGQGVRDKGSREGCYANSSVAGDKNLC